MGGNNKICIQCGVATTYLSGTVQYIQYNYTKCKDFVTFSVDYDLTVTYLYIHGRGHDTLQFFSYCWRRLVMSKVNILLAHKY